jgi:hypothetical protein
MYIVHCTVYTVLYNTPVQSSYAGGVPHKYLVANPTLFDFLFHMTWYEDIKQEIHVIFASWLRVGGGFM